MWTRPQDGCDVATVEVRSWVPRRGRGRKSVAGFSAEGHSRQRGPGSGCGAAEAAVGLQPWMRLNIATGDAVLDEAGGSIALKDVVGRLTARPQAHCRRQSWWARTCRYCASSPGSRGRVASGQSPWDSCRRQGRGMIAARSSSRGQGCGCRSEADRPAAVETEGEKPAGWEREPHASQAAVWDVP